MIVPVDRMLRLLFISSRTASLAVEISAINRNRRCVDKQYAGRLAVAVETMRSEFEVSGRTMSSSELSFLARHMNSENDSRTCLVALPAAAAPPAVRLVNKLRPLYPPSLSQSFRHHPPTHQRGQQNTPQHTYIPQQHRLSQTQHYHHHHYHHHHYDRRRRRRAHDRRYGLDPP